jgi:hypothetical protein
MRGLRTITARIVSVAVAVTIAVVASVTCYADEMIPAEMACCAAMAHNCGGMAQAHGCCQTESPRVVQASTGQRVHVTPPAAVVVAIIVVPFFDAALIPGAVGSPIASVKPPGIPRYLAVSSLRI